MAAATIIFGPLSAWAQEAAPARQSKAEQRKRVEAMLARPLNWKPPADTPITLAAFIQHLRTEHKLSVRVHDQALSLPVMFLSALDSDRDAFASLIAPDLDGVEGFDSDALAKTLMQQAGLTELDLRLQPTAGVILLRPLPVKLSENGDCTVDTGLRSLLRSASLPWSSIALMSGIPLATQAMDLDYLIQDETLVITTRLHANSQKEARVYSVQNLKCKPEELATVLKQTIRPWSWRSQTTAIAEKLANAFPKGKANVPAFSMSSGSVSVGTIQPSQPDVTPGSPVLPTPMSTTPTPEIDLAAFGQFLSGSAIAATETMLLATEILYHGDPPTGSMATLPGVLVITQSQSAHREIEDLLAELEAACAPAAKPSAPDKQKQPDSSESREK